MSAPFPPTGTPGGYPGELQQPPAPVRVLPPVQTPWVTYFILGITILVFLLQNASLSFYGEDLPANLGAKVNEAIQAGELWRLFTPLLLHASLMHIAFNMIALINLGPLLERHFGHLRFLALYLLTGFAGNTASFIFSPNPSLGASTALFGILGAAGVFFYQNRELFRRSRQVLNQIIIVAVINLIIGLSPGIDNWGHVGGLVAGLFFAWFGGPLLKVEGFYPDLILADQREERQVLLAGFVTAAVIAALVLGTLSLRSH